jgi:hypothetical protein
LLLSKLKAQKILLQAGMPFGSEIAGMARVFTGRHCGKMGRSAAVQVIHIAVEEALTELRGTVRKLPPDTLPGFARLLL